MKAKQNQELIKLAKQAQHTLDLLIEQCDNWLPPPVRDNNNQLQTKQINIFKRLVKQFKL